MEGNADKRTKKVVDVSHGSWQDAVRYVSFVALFRRWKARNATGKRDRGGGCVRVCVVETNVLQEARVCRRDVVNVADAHAGAGDGVVIAEVDVVVAMKVAVAVNIGIGTADSQRYGMCRAGGRCRVSSVSMIARRLTRNIANG